MKPLQNTHRNGEELVEFFRRNNMNELITNKFVRILNIGISLSAERNYNNLLNTILREAIAIAGCDAGTLYLADNNMLHFTIMHNHTLKRYENAEKGSIILPPVNLEENNVVAHVAAHRKIVNISDIYASSEFKFNDLMFYDKLTGYKTRSILALPLQNSRNEIVGVLLLINALNANNNVIPFEKGLEPIFRAISSQAAIAVTNARYKKESEELFYSFVEVLSAAIDERSRYNASHTQNVVELIRGFLEFLNGKNDRGECDLSFDPVEEEQLIIAAWLHDVGKIITPLEVMDKATRLGNEERFVNLRFNTIYSAEYANFLAGKMDEQQWNQLSSEINDAKALCTKANSGAPSSDEEMQQIRDMGQRTTTLPTGETVCWLEPHEIESLSIKYGTLTQGERKIMEDHVAITKRLLDKIKFSHEFKNVPLFAAGHHEKLNGTGYPNRLSAQEIPLGTRILTVMDIFEALTAKDRPYKKEISMDKAFHIMDDMCATGELDPELVALLKEWKLSA